MNLELADYLFIAFVLLAVIPLNIYTAKRKTPMDNNKIPTRPTLHDIRATLKEADALGWHSGKKALEMLCDFLDRGPLVATVTGHLGNEKIREMVNEGVAEGLKQFDRQPNPHSRIFDGFIMDPRDIQRELQVEKDKNAKLVESLNALHREAHGKFWHPDRYKSFEDMQAASIKHIRQMNSQIDVQQREKDSVVQTATGWVKRLSEALGVKHDGGEKAQGTFDRCMAALDALFQERDDAHREIRGLRMANPPASIDHRTYVVEIAKALGMRDNFGHLTIEGIKDEILAHVHKAWDAGALEEDDLFRMTAIRLDEAMYARAAVKKISDASYKILDKRVGDLGGGRHTID